MKDKIIIGIATALATTFILWMVGLLKTIPTIISVPSGGVVAFDAEECPDGWGEYKAAHGMFIRGIDRSGTNIDPDGERQTGASQGDMLIAHTHEGEYRHLYPKGMGGPGSKNLMIAGGQGTSRFALEPDGGAETRPKNIALLYCFKK